MSSPSARPARPGIAVVCLLVAAVGVAAAHPIVLLEDRSLTVTAGERVRVPVRFHDAERATLTVTGGDGTEFRATVVDADRDGSVVVTFDTAAAGAGNATATFGAESGEVRNPAVENPPDGGLPPGEYTVTVSPPMGGHDEGTLRVTPGASTATVDEAGGSVGTGSGSRAAEPDRPAPSSPGRDGSGLPWPPVLLLALFGPAALVLAFAGVSRFRGG